MHIEHGTGGIPSKYDIRDYWYSPIGRGAIDWATGYDIEKIVGTIPTKDQGKSYSCGGQAWAYYGAVLEKIATGDLEERSARWIYSHTHAIPGGGSSAYANNDFCIKTGWVREALVTSYEGKSAPSEAFITQSVPTTPDIISDTAYAKALSYLKVQPNIDLIAQAIQDNYGVILLVQGEDNGSWRSSFPKPPSVGVWAHWLYASKFKIINGKKYIGVKNSWGDKTGDKGWQWLGEDYFKSGFINEGWTMQWDYKPAAHKVAAQKTIAILQQIIELYKKLLNK